MKVKIGNRVYDSRETPIMLILKRHEKGEIFGITGEKYCQYPAHLDESEILEWMENIEDKFVRVISN